MMDIALYELSDSEVATALELTWKVFMEFEAPDYSQEGIDEFRGFLTNHVEMEKLRFYGAFSGESMVGVLAMRQSHISLLFVEKEFHRQGIARNLFQYMLSHTPYDSITVNSSPYALEAYGKLGFTATSAEQITNGIRYTPMIYARKAMINEFVMTERLMIRFAKINDSEAIFSYRSDVLENKYQGWLPESVNDVRDYIKRMPITFDVADVCLQFVIIEKSKNLLIGDMGIRFTNHNNMQAEIGCTLNKDFQGNGYATEAVRAMVDYLFMRLNIHRIIASIDPRNTASIQLIERLGFRKEAHFKESYFLRGDWVDDVIYAKLRSEWGNSTR